MLIQNLIERSDYMYNPQQPPFPPGASPQIPSSQNQNSQSNIYNQPLAPQPPQNPNNNPSPNVIYDCALKMPVYTSAIKQDLFLKGTDNIWYYIRTNSNAITKREVLFPFQIISIKIIDQDDFARFRFLVIEYIVSSSLSTTVIPFKAFMKKKLQDFFFLPPGFRISNTKDNVINEFLYYCILQCNNITIVSTYPHQGWNIDKVGSLVFECNNRYEEIFKSYLTPSILKRSADLPYPYAERKMHELLRMLPDSWEIKLLVALRISSLMLCFTYLNHINPKQLFIIESTNDTNTALISALLKTNNDYDNDLLTTSVKKAELISKVSELSDGVALIYDFSSTDSSDAPSLSLSVLSEHLNYNAHNKDSTKQLIAIVSQFAHYNLEPEKYYILNTDKINTFIDFKELKQLLTEIDYAVVSYFNGKNANDAKILYLSYINTQTDNTIPNEIKDTYHMINCAMSVFNRISYDKSYNNPNIPYVQYFTDTDINMINSFLLKIDRTGQYPIKRIIENFVNQLNRAFRYHFKCLPLTPYIIDDVTDEVVLTDEEFIYIDPTAIDSLIIPYMDIQIKHRPLIKTLFNNKIITGEYHYCCRLQYIDVFLETHQIYRYRINRSILSTESQIAINKAENSLFFHELSSIHNSRFIPFIMDEDSATWAGRIIENGTKSNNHMLITGESASGKSHMMIRIAAYLAEMGERVIMLDPSNSNTVDELKEALSEEFFNDNIIVYHLEKQGFPIDPFSVEGINRKDSKANHIFNIIKSAVYDSSEAQNAKLKTLIYENIDALEKEGRILPSDIKNILVEDGSTISALRDKLIPLLVTLENGINYEKTWSDYLNCPKKIIVFSLETSLKEQGRKLFDILLASLYLYHVKHRYSNLWLCIDEIREQNLKEDGVINMIFTQGRKNRMNIIGATQGFELSRSEEWTTLNNAKTKVFFKPLSTSITDVLKELDMSESKRSVFTNMQQRECIIKSELYSKKGKNNQPAIVRGFVPNHYISIKDLIDSDSAETQNQN